MNQELDAYWHGDFTLGQDSDEGPEQNPDRHAEELTAPLPVEQLAAPDITVRGRNLAALLAPVYRVLGS